MSANTFYMKNATTLNISAVNASGAAKPFNYQIKDKKSGYSVKQGFMSYVTNFLAYVPRREELSQS